MTGRGMRMMLLEMTGKAGGEGDSHNHVEVVGVVCGDMGDGFGSASLIGQYSDTGLLKPVYLVQNTRYYFHDDLL